MATYTTNEAAEYVAPLTSDSGNVFCVYSEISLAGKSAGDVFELVNLPRGARVVEVLAKGTQDTQGGKISLGTNDDIDDIGAVNVDGKVAVVANVGNLIKPATKSEFQGELKRLPPFLFSHSHCF